MQYQKPEIQDQIDLEGELAKGRNGRNGRRNGRNGRNGRGSSRS